MHSTAHASARGEWRFDVALDGRPIGYHRFELSERDGERELRSEAKFNVRFLVFDAYRYTHEAREIWQGDCLQQLVARTDDNGDELTVRGVRESAGFVVATPERTAQLERCVQTFAYWNPRILEATELLNPQTGDLIPVTVTRVGNETIDVRGRPVEAERFRLKGTSRSGETLQIDLWYSAQRDWLALETLANGGRRLRYTIR
jgi:hypothetical protein